MTSDKMDKARGLLLAALMVLSVVAGTAAFSGAAAAQDVTTADRTIDSTEVQPGDTVEVTITVELSEEADGVQATDNFPAALDAEIPDQGALDQVNDDNVVFNKLETGSSFTLVYELTIPDDAANGTTYDISGAVSAPDEATITGDSTIEVVADDGDDGDNGDDGIDESDYDREIEPNKGYWSGQTLYTDVFSSGDEVVLEKQVGDNWQFQTDVPFEEPGEILFDSSDFETGTYRLSDQEGTTIEFDLREQDFSATADPTEVSNAGEGAVTEIEIDSNRQGYSLFIADSDLTPNEIEDVFGVEGVAIDWNEDGSDAADDTANALYVTSQSFGVSSTLEADFDGMDTGTYDTAFYVADTFVGDTTSISVSDAEAAQVNFVGAAFYGQELGDYVAIPVSLDNTDRANLIVGSEDAGYRLDLALEDGDDDGEVTVLFNTYGAGNDGWTAMAVDDDDSVSIEAEDDLSDLIDTGDYQLRLSTSGDFEDTADTPDRLGTVDILPRETVGMDVWTAPSGIYSDLEDAEDVSDAVDDETLTQDDTIANGQIMALEIEASGLQGMLSTSSLQDLLEDEKLGLVVAQTNPRQNRDAKVLDLGESLDNGNAKVINSPSADTLYVVVNTANAEFTPRDLAVEDEFVAEFEVKPGTLDVSPLADEGQIVSTTFSIDYAGADSTSLDTNAGDMLILPAEETNVTGMSTLATGTEFTIRVTGEDPDNRFVMRNTATVTNDGSFAATFNLSDAVEGTPLNIQVRSPAGEVVASAEGEVGQVGDVIVSDAAVDPESLQAGGAVTVTATVTNNGATEVTEDIALMVDDSTVDTESIVLESGESKDVSITISTRDLATGSHDVTLEVGDVSTSATFTIEAEPTATTTVAPPPTATPTEEPTATPTEEPTTTEGGDGPGFGIAVALVALLAAAFLAVRRQD